MTPFTTLSGTAAPLLEANVDTDIIFPARFLLITARRGLGRYAFHDRRFDRDGAEVADFILNRPPWRSAPILLAGDNFGCGSSREQAVWALAGFGIRAILAPGFGEIFHGNCYRNGVLPITLPPEQVALLADAAKAGRNIHIDLAAQTIADGSRILSFEIEPQRKQALLEGLDETGMLLGRHGAAIARFEAAQRLSQPWLHPTDQQP